MTIIWRLAVIILYCQFSNEKQVNDVIWKQTDDLTSNDWFLQFNMGYDGRRDRMPTWIFISSAIRSPEPCDPTGALGHGVTLSLVWRDRPQDEDLFRVVTLVDQTGQSRVESGRSEEANNSCQYGFIFRTSLAILYYRMIRAQTRQDRQGRHT